jgi:hypothetical protein
MAEPKKETVRIALPPRPEPAAPAPSIVKRDTARIVLPTRTPVTPIRRLPPQITPLPSAASESAPPTVLPRRPPVAPAPSTSPLLQPLPKPPGYTQESESGIHAVPPVRDEGSTAESGVNRGPKKETARISVLPRPTPVVQPTVNMTKTQPLLVQPAGSIQPAPVVITSRPITRPDTISKPLCWTLLGVSAVIFLIQIWNYVVS